MDAQVSDGDMAGTPENERGNRNGDGEQQDEPSTPRHTRRRHCKQGRDDQPSEGERFVGIGHQDVAFQDSSVIWSSPRYKTPIRLRIICRDSRCRSSSITPRHDRRLSVRSSSHAGREASVLCGTGEWVEFTSVQNETVCRFSLRYGSSFAGRVPPPAQPGVEEAR
jgi:hypothetical protein